MLAHATEAGRQAGSASRGVGLRWAGLRVWGAANGGKIDDVVLPPWAKGSAQEFIRLHRMVRPLPPSASCLHGRLCLRLRPYLDPERPDSTG